MKRYILTHNEIEGFHCYPNAPQICDFLSHRHRHIFVIECLFEVSHNEREIEIITQQNKIENYLKSKYGNPCEFCDMSCESIAEELMQKYKTHSVTVKEDNYGGATLTE